MGHREPYRFSQLRLHPVYEFNPVNEECTYNVTETRPTAYSAPNIDPHRTVDFSCS